MATPLASAVEKARRAITSARQRGTSVGEQNTKAALIEPILSALGWDIHDLEQVSREYRRKPKDNPVDYALFLGRVPSLFLEAKALDKDLGDRKWISQILSYATVVGVEWCILTNGDEYRIYNAHAPVDAEDKLFRTIKILDVAHHDQTIDTLGLLARDKLGDKQLWALWKAHFVDRRVREAIQQIFAAPEVRLINAIRAQVEDLSSAEVKESLKRADIRITFPMPSRPGFAQSIEMEPARKATDGSVRRPKKIVEHRVELTDLIEAKLLIPPVELEVTYKGRRLSAQVRADGKVTFEGAEYRSLSETGGMARVAVSGPPSDGRKLYQTNGWTFWCYRDPRTGKFEPIDRLRTEFLRRPKLAVVRA